MKVLYYFLIVIFSVINVYAQSGKSKFKEVYISKIPKPNFAAKLILKNLLFKDQENLKQNKVLDAGEEGFIEFVIQNQGKGDAYELIAVLNHKNGKQISYDKETFLGNLKSGESKSYKLKISGSQELKNNIVGFEIEIKEANGFDIGTTIVSFKTQELKQPVIEIVASTFSSESKIVELGETIFLDLILQNKGQGTSSNTNISFNLPPDVFSIDPNEISLGNISPNEIKKIRFSFVANKRFQGDVLTINSTINYEFSKNFRNSSKEFSVAIKQPILANNRTYVEGNYDQKIQINDYQNNQVSDVDTDIPVISKNINSHKYALIIGNEDYSTYQTGLVKEQNVAFARNDAQIFKEYCTKILGVPEEQTILALDVNYINFKQNINKLKELIKRDSLSEIYFFYAGHGLPDEISKEPYLIPVDGNGATLQYGAIKLSNLYSDLTEFKSRKIIVFLDACFSGGGRDAGLVAARGVKIQPKDNYLTGNIVVFTSSSGDQSSMPYTSKNHGIFTYFLLKKLKNDLGESTIDNLYKYIKENVSKQSILINSQPQDPNLLKNIDLEIGDWLIK